MMPDMSTLTQSIERYFQENFSADDQSQLVIYRGGQPVVDTSVGIDPQTLVPIYSVSKALSALAVAKLVDSGLLKLDEKVSHYWPEFGAADKGNVTVRQMLSHQAGLPDTRAGLTLSQIMSDHEASELLAQERPFWALGAGFGYHGITIGNLISELCFRITGRTIQKYYEDEIRKDVRADAYLGVPIEHHHRFVISLPPKQQSDPVHPYSLNAHVFRVFADSLSTEEKMANFFSTKNLEFGQSAAGGVANARGIAEVFNWATGFGGKRAGITSQTLEDMSQVQVFGYDLVGDWPIASFGTLFMKPSIAKRFGSFRGYGHDGAAGSWIVVDPEDEIVLSYVVRRFTHPGNFDSRLGAILEMVKK